MLAQRRRSAYYRLFAADGVLRHLVRAGEQVLDAGCSDGRGSEMLGPLGATGVDIYRPSLVHAAGAHRGGLGRGDTPQAGARLPPGGSERPWPHWALTIPASKGHCSKRAPGCWSAAKVVRWSSWGPLSCCRAWSRARTSTRSCGPTSPSASAL